MKKKIIIVDDDISLLKTLEIYFERMGLQVFPYLKGQPAKEKFNEIKPDYVLLDVLLPDMDGRELSRFIRSQNSKVPIVLMTGRDVFEIQNSLFYSGANEYILKPAPLDEIFIRVTSTNFKHSSDNNNIIQIGVFLLDQDAMTCLIEGRNADLSRTEFVILKTLIQAKGEIVSRGALQKNIEANIKTIEENSVHVYVGRLRKKLGKYASCVVTNRRGGYKFVC